MVLRTKDRARCLPAPDPHLTSGAPPTPPKRLWPDRGPAEHEQAHRAAAEPPEPGLCAKGDSADAPASSGLDAITKGGYVLAEPPQLASRRKPRRSSSPPAPRCNWPWRRRSSWPNARSPCAWSPCPPPTFDRQAPNTSPPCCPPNCRAWRRWKWAHRRLVEVRCRPWSVSMSYGESAPAPVLFKHPASP